MARETFIAKVNQRTAGFQATSLGNQWVIAIIFLQVHLVACTTCMLAALTATCQNPHLVLEGFLGWL